MREHTPIVLDQFNGYWDRGNTEEVPLDHFIDCNNLKFIGGNTFATRDGINLAQLTVPLTNIVRIYNYPTTNGNTLLVLTEGGKLYHVVDNLTTYGPILTIGAMIDFAFVPYAGRAYISPFTNNVTGDLRVEHGLANYNLYVYLGDGTPAREAGGVAPTGTISVSDGDPGYTDPGDKVFGVVFETNTGYFSQPGGLVMFTTDGTDSVSFGSVPVSTDDFVVARHIVASQTIVGFNGDVTGYSLYFIPGATINDNVATSLDDISFYDQDLIEDATYLFNEFTQIPAGAGLCIYHNRLCSWAEFANQSLVRVSAIGEPESIDQITGLLLVPPDGNPLTNAAELRDVLYVFKRSRTVAFVDSGDVPTTWPLTVVDNAIGTGVHGIATVIDSGHSNVDYLYVATYGGILLFNGTYISPELTWKIQNYWIQQDFKMKNRYIQILNDPTNMVIYCVTTDGNLLYGNYLNGLDPKAIRWCPWTFNTQVNSIALLNINQLIIGCNQGI